jgi:hypothetical protein
VSSKRFALRVGDFLHTDETAAKTSETDENRVFHFSQYCELPSRSQALPWHIFRCESMSLDSMQREGS